MGIRKPNANNRLKKNIAFEMFSYNRGIYQNQNVDFLFEKTVLHFKFFRTTVEYTKYDIWHLVEPPQRADLCLAYGLRLRIRLLPAAKKGGNVVN